ncbi:MAG TPA: hypothetical protein VKP59_05190 [Candidatus Thermoplasmatota archaeon]|nr:hypothetical protein [Candidatus Thermoplasmatota archaeon]
MDENKEIESIMEKKGVDRETAYKIFEERKEQRFIEEKHNIENEEPAIREGKATLTYIYETLDNYLYIDDYNRIDVILATVLSNMLSGTPIWLFIVGNSGDWKSAFVRSLEKLNNAMQIDQITKNTFASGQRKVQDLGSQLHKNSNILIFPDLASLTSSNKDDKNAIWGQMRNLYDGFINKQTGSGVKKTYWDCHVTILACSTPSIRDEILIHSQLGTRELMYDTTPDMVDNTFKMDMAWYNESFEEEMKKDIENCVINFIYQKRKTFNPKIDVTDDMKEFLKQEAQRLSILRSSGITDRYNNETINPIRPEIPTRLIKQFKRLYISLKNLDEEYPDEKIKEIISHIVDSSGNPIRSLVMDFMRYEKDWSNIQQLHVDTRLGRNVVKRELEVLWNIHVLDKKIEEEQVGGYVSNDGYGNETVRGGRVEKVSYYRFNGGMKQFDRKRKQSQLT